MVRDINETKRKSMESFKKAFKKSFENKLIKEEVTGKISAMVTIKEILDRGNIKGKDAKMLREVLEFLSKEFRIPLD